MSHLVLGIETSCDETAAAIVRGGEGRGGGPEILSSIVASQNDLHAEYRGVVPEIASRAHAERLLPVVREAAARAGVSLAGVQAVAVGHRPGLIGALLVGVAGAKALAWSLGVPLVGVDHVHAHLFAGLLVHPGGPVPPRLPEVEPSLPALGLVVSGGHTSIYHVAGPSALTRLGATIDDAMGEAFDKVAAILGLGFPGGPAVDHLAQSGNAAAFDLPVSALGKESLDLSFSGLKTAVLYAACGVPERGRSGLSLPCKLDAQGRADLCASFQRAAVRAVLMKLERAADRHRECRTLLVGGGVCANRALRAALEAFAVTRGLALVLPPLHLCVDNAAMIAGLGVRLLHERAWMSDSLSLAAVPTTAA
ncbi:MAG: tRNA (adenosine(37)-N6)-threonylcarbamoyltransferase complex transferase subunit TsaD [Phycisphaerales bacterium]